MLVEHIRSKMVIIHFLLNCFIFRDWELLPRKDSAPLLSTAVPITDHKKQTSLPGLIFCLFHMSMQQLSFQECSQAALSAIHIQAFLITEDNLKQILTQVWLSLSAACEFKQWKYLDTHKNTALLPLSKSSATVKGRKWNCFPGAIPTSSCLHAQGSSLDGDLQLPSVTKHCATYFLPLPCSKVLLQLHFPIFIL